MLAKGPVGLVIPTAVIGMFLLVMRLPTPDAHDQQRTWLARVGKITAPFAPLHFLRTCWSMRPLTAIAVALAVAAPWYIWVGLRTDGEFLRSFFLEHNFSRATQTMEGHRGNLLFYPVAILVGFFPWSVFAVPTWLDAFRNARRDEKSRAGYVFVACWVGVYVGLFSLAKTKLPSYVTPCYPALAIATACFIDRWAQDAALVSRLWSRAAFGVAMLVGIGLLVALPILAGSQLPDEEWLGLIGLVPCAGGLLALILAERQQRTRAALVYASAATVFVTLLFGVGAARVDRHQTNNLLLSAINARSDRPHVTSFGLLEPTWVFYGGRPVDELPISSSSQTMPSWVEADGKWIAKPTPSVDDLLAEPNDLFVITTDGLLSIFEERYPGQFEVIADEPYFLKSGRLLVLAPTAKALEARRPSVGVKR
jgi:4-amino-4-deoxy-L-arabinose transferase-like glycosyltransferase